MGEVFSYGYFTAEDTEVRRGLFLYVIHHTLDTVFEVYNMEVDEQTKFATTEFQVGQ